MYTIYILYSVLLNKFYIGFTGDNIEIRISKHLANHSGFTSKAKDWILCYTEIYETKESAMKREKQLKGWRSSTRIRALINKSSIE